jgi:natural product biosynthesis luciferase-like monooxygenase protein
MDFGIMFWGDALSGNQVTPDYYRGLIRLAQRADEQGFSGVWLPERHFHPWGGQHPNPSVLAAALATSTRAIKLRAGSVVLPLHAPIRVVEEWAVVDNLSGGRVELSIASGWKDDDFALAPGRYANRRADMWDGIERVQRLWRGEKVSAQNGSGVQIEIATFPKPVQREIPIWITSAGAVDTIARAGAAGFSVLTHLLGQDLDTVAKKLNVFRQNRIAAGLEGPGRIALTVHTFLGSDAKRAKHTVREAMTSYLLNSADLTIPTHRRAEWVETDATIKAQMMDMAFERYCGTGALLGSLASARANVERMRAMGVTEVCCLIDFGLPVDLVLESMDYLAELRGMFT